ncbi:hypothetical protein H2199_005915 [Coniosporium tulheliwenetii]|uniref:Uncharacterized protein n=1 Tax=Coniosporium tulheliwenetii TaxID=3383036 RepID=A0ACC2YZE2_9PEZI|nr:hypothetical protein H2199_005915 [Cladosporium sp. JES 115]
MSPPRISRQNSAETARQQFPLNDIDYESSPAAVAQELSNLQAIRRMSMDVNASDPDLPSFGSSFGVPAVAPSHSDSDDDAARLFGFLRELAPKEFKTFIEERVDKIKRRSGDSDTFLTAGFERQGSGSGLRRKKSMLSRQIDGPNGYRDGAERLERKRSIPGQSPSSPDGTSLQALEELVNDPSTMMRRLSIDASRRSLESGGETLRRSTRTNYRKGSLKKGERLPFSKRVAGRHADTDTESSPQVSPVDSNHEAPMVGVSRVQTEPMPARPETPENFSRPTRRPPKTSPPNETPPPLPEDIPKDSDSRTQPLPEPKTHTSPPSKQFHSRIASNGRTTAPLPGYQPPVPQIIETPPPSEPHRPSSMPTLPRPERVSSRDGPGGYTPQTPLPRSPPGLRQQPGRSPMMRQGMPPKPIDQTLNDMASHPSPLPGGNTRTDTLSFIPTFAEDKSKPKDKKAGQDSGARKTSWGWFSRSDSKEDEKERERKEKEEASKKGKGKLTKPSDSTRLDVLQTSIDGGRGRESLVLDRESVRLDDGSKKDPNRKSSGEAKKEKESGIFSSLFGASKKKDPDSKSKKNPATAASPRTHPRILRPDVDYNWTRFSILEERAIYRMAHIKLANPRRELYSQVLLSNFMYSYLAKVQQMHPQIQIGNAAQQKQQQRQQAQQKKMEMQHQAPEGSLYQRVQEQQQQQAQQQQNHQSDPTPVPAPTPNYAPDPVPSIPSINFDNLLPDPVASEEPKLPQRTLSLPTSAQLKTNGNYSVASSQHYLGQPGAKGGWQPPWEQPQLEKQEKQEKQEKLKGWGQQREQGKERERQQSQSLFDSSSSEEGREMW